MAGAWLILPTYNEAVNVEPFVRAVLPELAEAAPDHRILIVDDNSPDGTGRIADSLAKELDAVEVLHRAQKEGLGVAYLCRSDGGRLIVRGAGALMAAAGVALAVV